MVELFGDWFGNIVAIFIIVLIYMYLRLNSRKKLNSNRLDFYFSLIIFLISAFEVIGAFIFEQPYYGPAQGFILSILIMLISLGTGTISAIELRADKNKNAEVVL